ncbi:alpha/beta fold hydrolase [Acrocarpospora catenulata]|uniref:alpha/beta fold hydrolase n=1 Tax=Acrocarpospora catenulata TaxID=2836182 RepID=UPI001BDB46AC|nr:alpha/beta hydrolase [Acrocarpospora catenulata]
MGHTFVLVHGGFHGGWCWRHVAAALRGMGHTVTTPTLTGLGEKRHLVRQVEGPVTLVEDVVGHLFFEDLRDVVLVGHSLAGLAISGAADRVPERIRHLVYLDSLLAENGESAQDTIPREVAEQRRRHVAEQGGGHLWPVIPVGGLGIPEDHPKAQWVRERLTPNPFAAFAEPLTLENPVGNGLPATYIVCSDPIYPTLQGARDRARAYGWELRDLPTGHDAMVLVPDELAGMLAEIAGKLEGDS